MTDPSAKCPHKDYLFLGVDGAAYFFRCIACGEVLIKQRGKAWRLEPAKVTA